MSTNDCAASPEMFSPARFDFSGGAFDESARTEDIRFSPSGRVLAAASTFGTLHLFAVDLDSRPVRVLRRAEVRSTALSSPHGVEFLNERTLVVANRSGRISFFRIPAPDTWENRFELKPAQEMGAPWFGAQGTTRVLGNRNVLCGPGSVRLHNGRLLVCCNNRNTVSMHPYRVDSKVIETDAGTIVMSEGIEIPDGVAVSPDGAWIAISDHNHQRVALYHGSDYTPAGSLKDGNLVYPHGLCFDRTGRWLYVTDAGSRDVHAFDMQRPEGTGASDTSDFKFSVVDEDAFNKTRSAVPAEFRALEGGAKGIDIDPSNRILVITCQNQTLRFFENSGNGVRSS